MTEYDKYIRNTYDIVKPSIRDIQSDLTSYMNKFYKNINKMIDLYSEYDDITDDDYNNIVDSYNEEYEYIDDQYQNYKKELEGYDMEYTKTFVNYYNKMMDRIEENINSI